MTTQKKKVTKRSGTVKRTVFSCIISSMVFASSFLNAQETPFEGVSEQYSEIKNIQSSGETIDLMRGTVSYETIDSIIPGDNGLDIVLSRSYGKGEHVYGHNGGVGRMVNWHFELPRIIIHTIPLGFTQGWHIEQWDQYYEDPGSRRTGICNDPYPGEGSASKWDQTQGRGNAKRYWGGMQLKIPGQSARELIKHTDTSTRYPSTTKWVTTDDWIASCTADGSGFIVTAPNGTQYTMDVLQANYNLHQGVLNGAEQGLNVLLASKVEDLHGNEIEYVFETTQNQWEVAYERKIINGDIHWWKVFSNPDLLMPRFYHKLTQIKRNDASSPILIEFGYEDNSGIRTIDVNGRVFTYNYILETANACSYPSTTCDTEITYSTYLESVDLPDGSSWGYKYEGERMYRFESPIWVAGYVGPNRLTQVTTPAGAVIDYGFKVFDKLTHDPYDENIKLETKTVTYDTNASYVWTYDYNNHSGSTIKTEVTIGSDKKEFVFHNDKSFKHGLIKSSKNTRTDSSVQRLTEYTYAELAEIGEFTFKDYPKNTPDSLTTKSKLTETKITQDGTVYLTEYLNHDDYGKPTKIKETHSIENSVKKTKFTKLGYFNDTINWILGLPTTVDVAATDTASSYKRVFEIVYHDDSTVEGAYDGLGLPYEKKSFGRWVERYTEYTSRGNLQKVEYNVARTTGTGNRFQQYTNYKRGIPQTITLPARDTESNIFYRQEVDANGWITSREDLNRTETHFSYDGLGRRLANDLTNDDTYNMAWDDMLYSWSFDTDGQYVMEVQYCELNIARTACEGEIRLTRTEYYDGLMRLQKVTETDDTTTRYKNFSYDRYSQPIFESVWSTSASEAKGSTTQYDILQRVKSKSVSGFGSVTYDYLAGNKVRETDSVNSAALQSDINTIVTTTTYLAYGVPAYKQPTLISKHKNSVALANVVNSTTAISVNILDSVETIRQYGVDEDGTTPISFTESHKYDDYNLLCLVVRKDVGNTLYNFNALGEQNWMAQGVSNTTCTTTKPTTTGIAYTLDNLGEVSSVDYPDAKSDDVTYARDKNGNVTNLAAGTVVHTYQYNNQNLLQSESLAIGSEKTLQLGYRYTSMQHRDVITYPDGWALHSDPNAFGWPTQLKSYDSSDTLLETFATEVKLYMDEQLDSFKYGNEITYKMTRNSTSLLPRRIEDKLGSTVVNDLAYTYDLNGNIKSIIYDDDSNSSYSMTELDYDGLDRLTSVTGNSGIGSSSISYDPLGNIKSYSSKNTNLAYNYNYTNNRLSSVSGVNGKYDSVGYDARGNITNNGKTQLSFNYANQLYSADNGSYTYSYDGHNRRVKQTDSKGISYSLYSMDGILLYRETAVNADTGIGKATSYIYLGKKLIAKQTEEELPSNTRQHYKPFGETIETPKDEVGYAGHKFDTDLGLSYMQARYYDPVIGRFYSNDPVGYTGEVDTFNRYSYVANNPYKYSDPNGESKRPIATSSSSPTQVLINATANYYIRQTQNIDPSFRYQTVRPTRGSGSQISRQELNYLRGRYENALNANFCGPGASNPVPRDSTTGSPIGRIIVSSNGNAMIEPVGGNTIGAGRTLPGGVRQDTHTTYPNGSNYQRLNEAGHGAGSGPHGHGHGQGTGPGMRGQGPALNPNGEVVPRNSPEAHWPVNPPSS